MAYAALPGVTVLHGDAAQTLAGLDGGSVDAIVTSPPYADARLDYSHVEIGEYGPWARGWLAEARRVVGPHGTMMLNLGRVFRGGEEQGYWIEALAAARTVGWVWLDTLVWHKPNANPIRGRVSTDSTSTSWCWAVRSPSCSRMRCVPVTHPRPWPGCNEGGGEGRP